MRSRYPTFGSRRAHGWKPTCPRISRPRIGPPHEISFWPAESPGAGGWAGIAWPKEIGGRGYRCSSRSCGRGIRARRRPLPAQRLFVRLESCRPHVDCLRHTRAEGIALAQDPRRRGHLVSGLFGTRRRLRPRQFANSRPGRRRRARDRRTQDLVELRRHCGLAGASHPHRSRGAHLIGALVDHLPDARRRITVRPIRTMAGPRTYCEVFYESVRVPLSNVRGRLNNGWSTAMSRSASSAALPLWPC